MTSTLPGSSRMEAIQEAAAWLRQQNPRPSPVVPALRERFGLSPKEAVEAIQALLSEGAQ